MEISWIRKNNSPGIEIGLCGAEVGRERRPGPNKANKRYGRPHFAKAAACLAWEKNEGSVKLPRMFMSGKGFRLEVVGNGPNIYGGIIPGRMMPIERTSG